VDLCEFSKGHPMYVLRKSGCKRAMEDLFRILAAKSLDHGSTTTMKRQYCQATLKAR
jgi:hypothetical protein